MEGIPDAVCEQMILYGGLGSLSLRFGDRPFVRRLAVQIRGGNGPISVALPPDMSARITVERVREVSVGDGLMKLDATDGDTRIYHTTGYSAAYDKTVEIWISGGSSVFLNPL